MSKTRMICALVPLLVLVSLAASPPMRAQTGESYTLTWSGISGGGVTAGAGNPYALNASLGQTVAGSLTGGPYGLTGGVWPCSPAGAAAEVTIAPAGATGVELTWADVGEADVWQGAAPYFAPGDANSVLAGHGADPPLALSGVLGGPEGSVYFLVFNVNGCGPSAASNRTGGISFELVAGS